MSPERSASAAFLLCRGGARLCALPLEHVAETMRPLPCNTLHGLPAPLLGAAMIRAHVVPVLDLAALLGTPASAPQRYVTVRLPGDRAVALAVTDVLGVRVLALESGDATPPLLRDVAHDHVQVVARLDAELLLVLEASHLVPDAVWAALDAKSATA